MGVGDDPVSMDERLISGGAVDLGLFTRPEILAAGYDDNYITRMVRSGIWHRVRNGAFIAASAWERFDEVDRHRVRSRAVLRKARSEGVLSHVSALAEYGAPFWDLALDDVHLTRFDQRAGRREAGVCQHRWATVGRADVTLPQRRDGDVSRPHRARHHGDHRHRARRGGRMQHAEGRAVHRCPSSSMRTPRSSRGRIRSAPGWCSASWTRASSRSARCGPPSTAGRRGCLVRSPSSRSARRAGCVAKLDFAWPEHRVWLEFDGRSKYVDY